MVTEKNTQCKDAQFKKDKIKGELYNISCKKGRDHAE
jgi:hypothetical protein